MRSFLCPMFLSYSTRNYCRRHWQFFLSFSFGRCWDSDNRLCLDFKSTIFRLYCNLCLSSIHQHCHSKCCHILCTYPFFHCATSQIYASIILSFQIHVNHYFLCAFLFYSIIHILHSYINFFFTIFYKLLIYRFLDAILMTDFMKRTDLQDLTKQSILIQRRKL